MKTTSIQKYLNMRATALEKLLFVRHLNGKEDSIEYPNYDYKIGVAQFRQFSQQFSGMKARGTFSYFIV